MRMSGQEHRSEPTLEDEGQHPSGRDQDAEPTLNAPGESGVSGVVAPRSPVADSPMAPDPQTCGICGALVGKADVSRHGEWHERLVDDVVSAVRARSADSADDLDR